MANKLLLSSLALSLVFILGVHSDDIRHYDGYTVYRLTPTTKSQLKYLHDLEENHIELDFWKSPSALNKPVDVSIPPHLKQSFEKIFRKKHFSKITLIDDLEKTLVKERLLQRNPPQDVSTRDEAIPGFWNSYQRLSNIFTFLSTIQSQYPSITAVETIGKSYSGNDLRLIRVGVNQSGKTKPVIFVDSGIHAREWIGPAFTTYFIQYLVDGYKNNDADVLPLLQKFDFLVLPVVNPDGYEYTHTNDRMWRKTRKPSSSTCIGTDPNRNFGYQWGGQGASTNPCSETYRGASAFSEPETKALSDYITSIKSRVKAYFAVHSYGQYWLYPWGYTSAVTPDDAALNAKGKLAVAALTALYNTRYTIGTSTNVLYAAAGGADDWAYGGAGVKYSHTIELRDTGANGFTLPASQIKPTSIETTAAFIAFAKSLATEV